MNADVGAYAEKMVRDEWQRKIVAHGEGKCAECGHSGWTHGAGGCVAFRAYTPTKMITMLGVDLSVVDIPDDAKIEHYYCGCKGNLCKTNEQIIWE